MSTVLTDDLSIGDMQHHWHETGTAPMEGTTPKGEFIHLASNAKTNTIRLASMAASTPKFSLTWKKSYTPYPAWQMEYNNGEPAWLVLPPGQKRTIPSNGNGNHTTWHVPKVILVSSIPHDRRNSSQYSTIP